MARSSVPQLREAMLKLNPKLAVILTDCCSGGTPESTPVAKEGAALAKTAVPLPKGSGSVVRDLLFRHDGLVVITAAKIGDLGFAGKQEGSYFTVALVKMFQAPVAQFDKNHNGLVEWALEFFPKLSQATQRTAAIESAAAGSAGVPFPEAQKFRAVAISGPKLRSCVSVSHDAMRTLNEMGRRPSPAGAISR